MFATNSIIDIDRHEKTEKYLEKKNFWINLLYHLL